MSNHITGSRKRLPLFLSAREVADLLGVHENTIYANGKHLPRVVIGEGKGALVRYDRDALFYLARRDLLPKIAVSLLDNIKIVTGHPKSDTINQEEYELEKAIKTIQEYIRKTKEQEKKK